MTIFFPHQPGDRVRHPFFGPGTIRDVGERYLTVLFDEGGETLLKIDSNELEPEDEYPGAIPEPDESPREIHLSDSEGSESGVLNPGDRVVHQKFGKGIVRVVKNYEERNDISVTVQFDIPYGSVRTILGSFLTRIAHDDPDWPADTFTQEEVDEQDVQSCWKPFEGASYLGQHSDEIGASKLITTCLSNLKGAPFPVPPTWPEGVYLDWPSHESGVRTVEIVTPTEDWLDLVTVFPFFSMGSRHTATLEQVVVRKNGCEANIAALLGEASIDFYDTAYLINRAWYKAGREYEFILTGIAYTARPASSERFTIRQDPEVAAWIARRERERGHEVLPDLEPVFSMKGMAALLPMEEGNRDEYTFRGPIQSIQEIDDILGWRAWLIEVTVLRFSEDVNFKILVTRSAWQGDEPPEVGTDVEGSLWLQGYMGLAHT
jgi:hypothetical protein